MWPRVQKSTKRKWKMAELFADERCSEAILEFLRTNVGRKVPTEKAIEAERRDRLLRACRDALFGNYSSHSHTIKK